MMHMPRFMPALALATIVSGFFAASLAPTADARLIRWRTLMLSDPTPLPGDEPYVVGENQTWPFDFRLQLPVRSLSFYDVNGVDVTENENQFNHFIACFDIDPDTLEVVYFRAAFGENGRSPFASAPYGCGSRINALDPSIAPPNQAFARSSFGSSTIRFTGRRSAGTEAEDLELDDYLLLQFDGELPKDGGVVGIIPFDPTFETFEIPYLEWLRVEPIFSDLLVFEGRVDGGSVFVQDSGAVFELSDGSRGGIRRVGGVLPSLVNADYSSPRGRMVLVGTPAPIQPDIAEPFYTLDSADVNLFLDRFNNEEIAADLNDNDDFDFFDLQIYLDAIE
ncbi:MAG: hypothetical protein AAGB34_02645 [Planctomycetota bacterium]